MKSPLNLVCIIASIFFVLVSCTNYSKAQEIILEQEIDIEDVALDDIEGRLALTTPDINLNQISSLFLTPNEISLLKEALIGFATRPPTRSEVEADQDEAKSDAIVRPNSVREVSLGGILYRSSNDWAIWINSQKITPKNIPPAIIDISVSKDEIKMKWLDFQTNQIFPVKLRTNQRFNFDTRIFLPG